MLLEFGNVSIDTEVIENTVNIVADAAIKNIAKAVPEKCLCLTVIEEILKRAKRNIQTMPIAYFQQCLEENKK